MRPIRLLAIVEAAVITGPAKNLLQFAQLARSGACGRQVEVSVAVFERGPAQNLFVDRAKALSLPVYSIPESSAWDPAVVDRLRTAFRQASPDIIQTHAVKSHFLTRVSGAGRIAPWIAFHHGYTWQDLRMRLYNQLDRWSLRGASLVLTVSQPFRRELIARGVKPSSLEVVHNAVDAAWAADARSPRAAHELRSRLGLGPETRVLLIVGRLSREKDHHSLLEAVRIVRQQFASVHLLVVGDGPQRAAIEASVRHLGLTGAVTLTGHVPTAEPYYGIGDVAVLSSRTEGSPNALLEAMAAGVPVVATAVGGIPEIVTHNETALLVKPGDRGALAQAIGALLADPALAGRLAARARETVAAYTPESRAARLIAIYQRMARCD